MYLRRVASNAADGHTLREVIDGARQQGRAVGAKAAHGLLGQVAQALAAVPASAFALTKRLLRGPVLERIHVGAALDAVVQDAWASAEIVDAVRGYVERTLGKR